MGLIILFAATAKRRIPAPKGPIHRNAVGVGHAITGIDWPTLAPRLVANEAGVTHDITGLEWTVYTLSLDTFDEANAAGIGHAITALQWILEGTLGDNQFINPGFEDGINWYSIHDATNGFYGQVTSTAVAGEFHSGSKAAKLVSGTTDPTNITRLSQDCATTPGKTYMLSFWAKGDGVNTPHFFMYDRTTDASITPEPVPITGLTTDWQKVSYTFVAPAGATLARSVLYAPYVVGGTVWYDDLYFGEVTVASLDVTEEPNTAGLAHAITNLDWALYVVPVDTYEHYAGVAIAHVVTGVDWEVIPVNEMSNEGFESDLDWWTPTDSRNGANGTVAVVTAEGQIHSGAKAVKLTSGTVDMTTEPRLQQDNTLVAGSRYALKFWCRGDGTNDGRFFMYDKTTDVDITPGVMSTDNTSTTWQQVEFAFVVPSGGSNVRLLLYGASVGLGEVWFDDFSITLRPLTPVSANPVDASAGLAHGVSSVNWIVPVPTYEHGAQTGVAHLITNVDWDVASTPITTYENTGQVGVASAITNIDWEVAAPNLWDGYNPAFESDFANWVKNDATNGNHGTASIATAAGEFYSGTKAARLAADGSTFYDTNPWLHRDTILQPSTNYRLSFWCRGDGTNAGKFFIHDRTTNTYITPADVSTGNATTTWQKVTYDFTTPAGASNVRIFLENPGTINSVVWFDECSLSTR